MVDQGPLPARAESDYRSGMERRTSSKPSRQKGALPAPVSPPDVSAEHRTVLTEAFKAGLILAWKRDVDRGYCLSRAGRVDEYVELDQLPRYLERLRAT